MSNDLMLVRIALDDYVPAEALFYGSFLLNTAGWGLLSLPRKAGDEA